CLLGTARYPSPREWQALLRWVNGGGKLLVAARWNDADLTIPGIEIRVESTKNKQSLKLPGAAKGNKSASPASDGGTKSTPDAKSTRASQQAATAVAVSTRLVPEAEFTWKTEGAIVAPSIERANLDSTGASSTGADVLVKSKDSPQAVRIRHGLGSIVLVA